MSRASSAYVHCRESIARVEELQRLPEATRQLHLRQRIFEALTAVQRLKGPERVAATKLLHEAIATRSSRPGRPMVIRYDGGAITGEER